MKTKERWKCQEIFVNNEPNQFIVAENKWQGKIMAQFGTRKEDAELIAELLNARENRLIKS